MSTTLSHRHTLRIQRRQSRRLARNLLGALVAALSVATVLGVLVVGNHEGARQALLSALGAA